VQDDRNQKGANLSTLRALVVFQAKDDLVPGGCRHHGVPRDPHADQRPLALGVQRLLLRSLLRGVRQLRRLRNPFYSTALNTGGKTTNYNPRS